MRFVLQAGGFAPDMVVDDMEEPSAEMVSDTVSETGSETGSDDECSSRHVIATAVSMLVDDMEESSAEMVSDTVSEKGSETGSDDECSSRHVIATAVSMLVYNTTPATIGNGVEVKESLLEDAGRGLFAQRKFVGRDLITMYAGKKLEDKFAAAQCDPQTHIIHMSTARNNEIGNDVYIDGDREPVEGSGGGSFANHVKFKKDCNAEYTLVNGDVFLRATREIENGEEIYAHCGTDLDVMMGRKKRVVTTNVNRGRSIATVETSAPYFEYFGADPHPKLDEYMALCGALIHVQGKTAKDTDSYRLYGEHHWEYRKPALKSRAAREQGYLTLMSFSGEGTLCGGTTFRPVGDKTYEIIMLRVTATGEGVGSALLGTLKEDLVAAHGDRTVLLAEAVEGPASDKEKVVRFFSERCGFQRSEEAKQILDVCYLEKERQFYEDQRVDVNDACAVDEARREWTRPWTGDEEADRDRAQLTFSWNTCRAPYKMIWRTSHESDTLQFEREWTTLQTEGAVHIVRKNHTIGVPPFATQPKYVGIFNDNVADEFCHRQQARFIRDKVVDPEIIDFEGDVHRELHDRRGWLRTSSGTGRNVFKQVCDGYKLKSVASCYDALPWKRTTRRCTCENGCLAQLYHAESCMEEKLLKENCPWADVPLVVLMARTDNTPFHYYPFGSDEACTIILMKGDIVIFRGVTCRLLEPQTLLSHALYIEMCTLLCSHNPR